MSINTFSDAVAVVRIELAQLTYDQQLKVYNRVPEYHREILIDAGRYSIREKSPYEMPFGEELLDETFSTISEDFELIKPILKRCFVIKSEPQIEENGSLLSKLMKFIKEFFLFFFSHQGEFMAEQKHLAREKMTLPELIVKREQELENIRNDIDKFWKDVSDADGKTEGEEDEKHYQLLLKQKNHAVALQYVLATNLDQLKNLNISENPQENVNLTPSNEESVLASVTPGQEEDDS